MPPFQQCRLDMMQWFALSYDILLMISDIEKRQMIGHFMSEVRQEDFLNIGFMKPLQVSLRTHKTDKNVPSQALPQGLLMAIKDKGINDNKFKLQDIKPIGHDISTLQELRDKHLDNYISLLKKPKLEHVEMAPMQVERESMADKVKEPPHHGLELGICISMCKEEKKMLKRTLIGVTENIDEMIRCGMCPDDIFVVVMMDGITNVDSSMYEYFEEFERESEIFLEDDEDLSLKKKYQNYQYHQEIEKDQPLNFAKFLFKPEEFSERVEGKFEKVRAKYDDVLRVKESIKNIKKEKNKDNDNLKIILNRMMDKQKAILKKVGGKGEAIVSEQGIMKELANSEEECNQYVSTRDTLAYVQAYKLATDSLSQTCKDKENSLTIQRSTLIAGNRDTERMYEEPQAEESESENLHKPKVDKSVRYVNLFFCIKYKETGKLSSHNWFFNGFCHQLQPKYSVLIDVGVRPYPDSIFKMYRCMKLDPLVGSVCGYLRLVEERVDEEDKTLATDELDCLSSMLTFVFDLQRAQQMEYHLEHMMDKPFQASFRFIHVLSGSFSAYNMNALKPSGYSDQLLQSYFRSMDDKLASNKVVPSVFSKKNILTRVMFPKTVWRWCNPIDPDSQEQVLYDQNTNLSEDRILCLGIHNNDRNIVFMPDVFAKVEPIKMMNNFMGEKKRDINGGTYSFEKVSDAFSDSDSKRTTFFLRFQLFYLSFTKFLTYFGPSILLFFIEFAFQIIRTDFLYGVFASQRVSYTQPQDLGNIFYNTFTNIIMFIYALMILASFFFSLHLDYTNKEFIYYMTLITTYLGSMCFLTFIVLLVETIQGYIGKGHYLRESYEHEIELLLPGMGQLLVNLYRYMMVGALFIFVLPSTIFTIMFRKMGILWEMIMGVMASIFYIPTYLVVLPIYAKCHLDDIPSGGATGARNARLKESWKILKMIEVSKFVLWNVICSALLLVTHEYLLVKFFFLLFLLLMFIIIQIIRVIPVLSYHIGYKCRLRSNPLVPSPQEMQESSNSNVFRIYNILKRFEDDFRTQIEYSFALAAEEVEYNQKMMNPDFAASTSELPFNKSSIKLEPQPTPEGVPPPPVVAGPQPSFRASRQSIKLMKMFQEKKFTNIRESSALKGTYYPKQYGNAKPPVETKPLVAPELQMLLLKQQVGQGVPNSELKVDAEKLKKYQNFRNTIRATRGGL